VVAITLAVFVAGPTWAAGSRTEIISTFHEYVALNNDFKSSVESGKGQSGKSHAQLREEVEHYHRSVYLPKVRETKELVCKRKDKEVLAEFVKVLVNDTNSADEEPQNKLGEIFACQSDLVVSEFKKLNAVDSKIALDALEFGFGNTQKKSMPNYSILKGKLESLRK
jgi:hypothetical protein